MSTTSTSPAERIRGLVEADPVVMLEIAAAIADEEGRWPSDAVGELAAEHARRIAEADTTRVRAALEHMLMGPLTADPSDPYFKRRRNKAVITRSDKTDLQLAALHTQTDVLILTGGFPPSPYTIDRAAGEEVPILLTRAGTPESVARLADVFGVSRFNNESKLMRLRELLEEAWSLDQMIAATGLSAVGSTSTV